MNTTSAVERLQELQAAVKKFLIDTSYTPPWESAGAIWAQHVKQLQMKWLDSMTEEEKNAVNQETQL